MKKSHQIISQLKNTEALSRLKENDEISKLIYSLTLEMRKYIAFGYKKEEILFFALKNPNLCAEFNTFKSPIILQLIHSLKEHFPLLSSIKKIKAYYPSPMPNLSIPQNQITKDELNKLLKEKKTYKERRQVIKDFQAQGKLFFLPPKHSARYHEIIEVYFLQAYAERSNGGFEIHAKDPKLKAIFDSIRQRIRDNHLRLS